MACSPRFSITDLPALGCIAEPSLTADALLFVVAASLSFSSFACFERAPGRLAECNKDEREERSRQSFKCTHTHKHTQKRV